MKYITMLLSFITSFALAMLCIQTTRWDDGLSYTILTTMFAFLFMAVGVELKNKIKRE